MEDWVAKIDFAAGHVGLPFNSEAILHGGACYVNLIISLPGLTNIWISVLKDTALVALAGLNEIVARSRTAAGATKEPFLFFIAAALFFILFSAATLKFSARLERRLDRGVPQPAAAGGTT